MNNDHDGAAFQERLAFHGFDAAARRALSAIQPFVDREMPRALDRFYERLRATPQTRRFFSDEAAIGRARARQIEHWRLLSSGQLDAAALANARRVGETHARIGLRPDWYAAGYGVIADHLLRAVVAALWPKRFWRRGAFDAGQAGAAL